MKLWPREDLFKSGTVDKVYSDLTEFTPDANYMNRLARLSGRLFSPEVKLVGISEDEVGDVLSSATIVSSTHEEFVDPFMTLIAIDAIGHVDKLGGRMREVVNASAFTGAMWRRSGIAQFVINMGGLPIVTRSNYVRYQKLHQSEISQQEYIEKANRATARTLDNGLLLYYPEGHLNHKAGVSKFKAGMGHIAARSAQDRETYILPTHNYYSVGRLRSAIGRRVTTTVGEPIRVESHLSHQQVTEMAQAATVKLSQAS